MAPRREQADSLANELDRALTVGPSSVATYLQRLFAGDLLGDDHPQTSPEWLFDLQISTFNEPQRATLRDGLLRLLMVASTMKAPDRSPVHVKSLTLAGHLELLERGPRRVDDLVWATVRAHIAVGNSLQASQTLAFLANHGRIRPIRTWTEQLRANQEGGALTSCFEGVLRHGVQAAVRWLFEESGATAAEAQEVLAGYLPIMAAVNHDAVEALLTSGEVPLDARERLYEWFARYGVRLENRLNSSVLAPAWASLALRSLEGADDNVETAFDLYDEIDASSASPFEAIVRYSGTDSLPVPKVIIDIALGDHPGDDV